MKNRLFLLIFITMPLFFYVSCAPSATTVRTAKTNNNKKNIKEIKKVNNFRETFIITPYRTKIEFNLSSNRNINIYKNVWYGYKLNDIAEQDTSRINNEPNGYRVQIKSTDNIEEAQNLKRRVLPRISQRNVYIIFDPPFYKVQIGDFVYRSLAQNLNFKLKQLGYKFSRVVRERINHFN